ncbi:MAG: hypothetical protein ACK55I_41575, partial [bacterium]
DHRALDAQEDTVEVRFEADVVERLGPDGNDAAGWHHGDGHRRGHEPAAIALAERVGIDGRKIVSVKVPCDRRAPVAAVLVDPVPIGRLAHNLADERRCRQSRGNGW